MKNLAAVIGVFVVFACGETPTEPTEDAYTYTSNIDGERVTGIISFSNNPGFHFRGSYHIDGEYGEIDGAVVQNELQFLLIDFRGDTLRHVAVRGDTLRGTWERGAVVDGSWKGSDGRGTFVAEPVH